MPDTTRNGPDSRPDVKRRIINAAENLFANKGFDATTISDITKDADIARALIYYYFKDKQGLYESIIQDGNDCISQFAQEAVDTDGSSLDKLRVFMRRLRQMHIDRPNHSRLSIRVYLESSLTFDQQLKAGFDRISPLLKKIIMEGIHKGEIRDIDVDSIIHMVMGIVHSLVVMQIHNNYIDSTDRDIEFAIDFMAHGIANKLDDHDGD